MLQVLFVSMGLRGESGRARVGWGGGRKSESEGQTSGWWVGGAGCWEGGLGAAGQAPG